MTDLLSPLFKAPKYLLQISGFISPAFMNRREPAKIMVEDPRTIHVAETTFIVPDDQPDLPVGHQVQVDMTSHHVFARAVIDIEREDAELAQRKEQRKLHMDTLTEATRISEIANNQAALTGSDVVEALQERLVSLHAYTSQLNSLKMNAKYGVAENILLYDEAQAKMFGAYKAHEALFASLLESLNSKGYSLTTAYAYSPREGARDGFYSPGKDHVMTLSPLQHGKVKRVPYDALCKARKSFWGLEHISSQRTVSCPACADRLFSLYAKATKSH